MKNTIDVFRCVSCDEMVRGINLMECPCGGRLKKIAEQWQQGTIFDQDLDVHALLGDEELIREVTSKLGANVQVIGFGTIFDGEFHVEYSEGMILEMYHDLMNGIEKRLLAETIMDKYDEFRQ
jgi:hypothetical protein